ncbi:MFS transporter [bacterium]|nr:MAG: MFS transporter [bacterium]
MTVTPVPPSETLTSDSISSRQIWAASLASIFAWSLDLFDLFILLYIAPTIGPLFFPSNSPTLSLAAVYASFAVTLLMRPVGSALFGGYADKNGRKRAMIVAVFGVGIATALLGALPTIEAIGLLAPVLFLILRLVQGIFVGGVVASTHTIGTETVAPKWRGLLSGAIGGGGAGVGGLLASVVFLIVSLFFPGPAFAVWGWRFMFFSALVSTVLSFFIFRAVEESPLWARQERQAGVVKAPVREVFSRKYAGVVLVNLLITFGGGAMYYLTSGYLPAFLAKVNHLPKPAAAHILIWLSIVVIIVAPLVGHLSELVGRKPTLIGTGLVSLVVIPITYHRLALLGPGDIGAITAYAVILTILGNAAYAPILVFLNERFPTAIRSSGTGLSWNMGFAIGGMMPTFVTLASGSLAGIPLSLTIFLTVIVVLFLAGSIITPETRGRFA